MKRLAIGILAHVDAGKTTLGEALMYVSGDLKKRGRVDHGDSFLDTDLIERERGITIFSKQAVLTAGKASVTLLDTPGHVDFSAETERALQVMDYAVLVISGADGVQSHTKTLWELLRRHAVPTFLFVNKTDLPGFDRARVLSGLKSRLSDAVTDFSAPSSPAFYEDVALTDEALLTEYEETGGLSSPALAAAIRRRSLFPCFFGSALKLDGVEEFLRALDTCTLAPEPDKAFSARVFKVAVDKQGQKLTFLKVTGGELHVRDVLESPKNTAGEKVGAIRVYSGERFTSPEVLLPGQVAAVTGITFAAPGDGLGVSPDAEAPLLTPVLSFRVLPPPDVDIHRALADLRALEREDPVLGVAVEPRTGAIRVSLMGDVQAEVLKSRVRSRFGWEPSFERGGVLYKETIRTVVEGVGHFEPLRHYAEVHLILKPGARDSGLRFSSACREDDLDKNWQRLILTHLYEKTHLGVLTGSPVTDMEIVLASGRAHEKHTEGGDFRQATYRAVRQGLMRAEGVLLEPLYAFRMELPVSAVGRALTDIERAGGTADPPVSDGVTATVTGKAPVSSFCDYATVLTGYTRGAGRLSLSFSGYAECHNADEVIASIGYDPDSDPDNPADSVFCAHGAGHVVKWNEVPSRMHLPSALSAPKRVAAPADDDFVPKAKRRPDGRDDLFALDKELMQIFERTYGKIKDRGDPFQSYAPPPKQPKEKVYKFEPKYLGKEYLLVDGYNVIFSWDHLRKLAEADMGDARDTLTALLGNYRGYKGNEVILVFDAYRVKGSTREIDRVGDVSVVYTKEAETADTYIEKTSHELAKNYKVRVVTGDSMEQIIILGNGALRVSPEAFYDEVLAVEREIRERF
ncbi:MAG: TetM/TetW/TetO/TetS family tetracycline resistance ribosomal protection protein [Clostridia bacterium]|nr:TetM/TetW/TetO/TetS family tetracycline resistance ribosomal protection protein [Clostridia bacterium]